MDGAAGRADLEALLEESSWVRRLAGGLVGEEAADDLAQQTFLQALEQPPQERGRLRAWLATVARNLALQDRRRSARRLRREQVTAKPGHAPSTSELVSRVEMQRVVAREVIRLEDPYRTVLLLRYFEDLPPRRIATRLGLPVNTVETQLRRGRERLRARLNHRFGGDRSSWMPAMVALARPELGTLAGTLGWGATVMGMKTTVAVGAIVIALGVVLWPRGNAAPVVTEETTAGAPAGPEHLVQEAAPQLGLAGDPLDTRLLPAVGTAPGKNERFLVLQVLDEESMEAIPGSEVEVTWLGDSPEFQERRRRLIPDQIYDHSSASPRVRGVIHAATGVCDANGEFEVAWPEGGAALEIRIPTTSIHFGIHQGSWVPGEVEPATGRLRFPLTLSRRYGKVHGLVLDEQGRRVPDATVQVWWEGSISHYRDPDMEYAADQEGAFSLEGLWSRDGQVTLSAVAPGLVAVRRFSIHEAGKDRELGPVVLLLYPGRSVQGQVLDSSSAPVAEARLSIWRAYSSPMHDLPPGGEYLDEVAYAMEADQDGRFTLPVVSRQKFQIQADHPEHGTWRGYLEPEQDDLTIVFDDTARIVVRVLGHDGTPASGARVVARAWSFEREFRTDESGCCEFGGPLPGKELLIGVSAPGSAMALVGPFTVGQDPQVIEVGLSPELTIGGTVVDADGVPLAGRVLKVEGTRKVPEGDFNLAGHPWTEFLGLDEPGIRTAQDGSFRIVQLLPGRYQIRVLGERERECEPEAIVSVAAGTDDLTIVLGQGLAEWVSFSGVVRDPTTGEPVSCSIQLEALTEDGQRDRRRRGANALAGEDGRYRLQGVEPGSWILVFQKPGLAGWASPRRNYGAGMHTIDAELGPARNVKLLLAGQGGEPLSSIEVRVLGESGQELPFRDEPRLGWRLVGRCESDGRLDLFGLPNWRDVEIEFRQLRGDAKHRILLSSLMDMQEIQRVELPFDGPG